MTNLQDRDGHREGRGQPARPGRAVGRYWLQTLGCPKNQVDSDKLEGTLHAAGYDPAGSLGEADLVVVNTCAFIEAARQESVDTILDLADRRRDGARLVVTGCLAERYGDELAAELPEVDLVAGFGVSVVPAREDGVDVSGGRVPVALGSTRRMAVAELPAINSFDLLELPRPAAAAPWAYVKVAEGCDRRCGFCAIPSFRGAQRSRSAPQVIAEVESLVAGVPAVQEIVLVAQDLASYGRDRATRHDRRAGASSVHGASAPIVGLTRAVAERVARTRLLYLYPSGLTDELIETILSTGVPYFDLSLQHVSRPLLARMRRWGDGDRFLRRIETIRAAAPDATFRSSFILGYPGETEEDHDALLAFLAEAQLDWAGFFPFSPEVGTHAVDLDGQVPGTLALERLRECTDLQDTVTAARRDRLVGARLEVLVDAPGVARSVHEAPEIDGVIRVPAALPVGGLVDVLVTESLGTDLVAVPVASPAARVRQPARSGARP
jgi:ribosomal protein S12 methylthiotransferase